MSRAKVKRDPEVIARVELLFDLYATSEAIMRQNLRRRFPDADETEIESRLLAWLRDRPHDQWKAAEASAKATPEREP